MQHIILAVLLPSMTKQPSKHQICGEGVLGFSEKQFFLIILIFNLLYDTKCYCHIPINVFHAMKPQNNVLELFGE